MFMDNLSMRYHYLSNDCSVADEQASVA